MANQNLRLVWDNAIDRAATLVASTTAGAYAASNLLGDDKSTWWRSTVITATTLTATWAVGETIACAALPFFDGSPTATIRVQLYDATSGGTLLLDTNTLQPGALACPAAAIALRGWTPAQAASAYANGGGAYARIWFASTAGVKRMVVTLADPGNLLGYLEAAFLVAGPYWSPANSFEYGAAMLPIDSTVNYRTDAFTLKSDAGNTSRKVSINLPNMVPADRTVLANILRSCGRRWPVLLSLFPQNADLELERDNMVYGKFADLSELTIASLNRYAVQIPVEEL